MIEWGTETTTEDKGMSKKTLTIIRIFIGVYLAVLGVRILMQITETRPNNMAIMGVLAVIFILIGAAYTVYTARILLDIIKSEKEPDPGAAQEEEDAGEYAKETEQEPVKPKSLSDRAMAVVGPETQEEEPAGETAEDTADETAEDTVDETAGTASEVKQGEEELPDTDETPQTEDLENDFEEK